MLVKNSKNYFAIQVAEKKASCNRAYVRAIHRIALQASACSILAEGPIIDELSWSVPREVRWSIMTGAKIQIEINNQLLNEVE